VAGPTHLHPAEELEQVTLTPTGDEAADANAVSFAGMVTDGIAGKASAHGHVRCGRSRSDAAPVFAAFAIAYPLGMILDPPLAATGGGPPPPPPVR